GVDPRAERLCAAFGHRFVARRNQRGVDGDSQAFLARSHTLMVTRVRCLYNFARSSRQAVRGLPSFVMIRSRKSTDFIYRVDMADGTGKMQMGGSRAKLRLRVEGSGAVLCGPVERIVAATPMTAAAVKAIVRKVAGRAPAMSSSFAAIALTVAAALWAPGQPAYAQAPAPGEPLRITRITPAGQDAPAPRQIVVQFDRPV